MKNELSHQANLIRLIVNQLISPLIEQSSHYNINFFPLKNYLHEIKILFNTKNKSFCFLWF